MGARGGSLMPPQGMPQGLPITESQEMADIMRQIAEQESGANNSPLPMFGQRSLVQPPQPEAFRQLLVNDVMQQEAANNAIRGRMVEEQHNAEADMLIHQRLASELQQADADRQIRDRLAQQAHMASQQVEADARIREKLQYEARQAAEQDDMMRRNQAADQEIARAMKQRLGEAEAETYSNVGYPQLPLLQPQSPSVPPQNPYQDPLMRALNAQGFGSLLGSALMPMTSRENVQRLDDQRMTELTNMLTGNERQLLSLRTQIMQQEEQDHVIKSRLTGLRNLNTFIRTDIDRLTSSIGQVQAEKQVLGEDIGGLERDLADIEAELEQIKEANANNLNGNGDLRLQRGKFKDTLQRMDIEIEKYKTSYQSLKKRWDDDLRDEEVTSMTNRPTLSNWTDQRDVSPNVFDRYSVSADDRSSSNMLDETAYSVPSTYVQRYLSKDFKRHY